ncbi:MAG: hypothetical protein R3272_08040 [Candidatus Promineifilaceae bacterium]|nr:hypothetical protein [Candidatus Promineifilaceae bacterium]
MYPEDRVLVAYVPSPDDFAVARDEGWYRIPQKFAPKGLYAEYFAFYFGQRFGPQKWAVHYYAERQGHELATRLALVPDEPDHPRADELYYKVQLGPMQKLERPIISLRWRRVTFLHTTWDRFHDAVEINDLFLEGDAYVDRLYATLKERGLHPERNYAIRERGTAYLAPLAIPCREGVVELTAAERPRSEAEVLNVAEELMRAVAARGGESGRQSRGPASE